MAMITTSFAQDPKQDRQGERPAHPPLPPLEEVFAKADKNSDGSLSKEEFDAFRKEAAKQRQGQGRKQKEDKGNNTILPPRPPQRGPAQIPTPLN